MNVASIAKLLGKGAGLAGTTLLAPEMLPFLIGGYFLGNELLGQAGAASERGLARQQMATQEQMAQMGQQAAKRATKESRANTEKYLRELRKQRQDEKEMQLMQMFMAGQQQQLAGIFQAAQGMAANAGATGRQPMGPGITNILRSNL